MSLLARLRKLSAENNIKGTPEARDRCISQFLDEFSKVATTRLLNAVDDTVLHRLYVGWLNWCIEEHGPEERAQLFEACFFIAPSMARPSELPGPETETKVVSLFGG